MSGWMITVVEEPNVVTRITITSEMMARDTFNDLRGRKKEKGWLAVSFSKVKEQPSRSKEEKERAFKLLYT